MEKSKYQRMNKEEKELLKQKYFNTSKGKEMKIRLKRLLLVSIFCFFYSIYLLIDAYKNNGNTWAYTFSILIFICALFFFIAHYRISKKVLTKYATKK